MADMVLGHRADVASVPSLGGFASKLRRMVRRMEARARRHRWHTVARTLGMLDARDIGARHDGLERVARMFMMR